MIYFVQPEGRPYVKIGYAKAPWGRLDELQVGCPEELNLLGVMPGDQSQEFALHERFAHLRLRGEWFHLAEDIQSFIEAWTTKEQRPEGERLGGEKRWQAYKKQLLVKAIQNHAGNDKREVRVWIQRFSDRPHLVLQWIDPRTGLRKSKTARTDDRIEAEHLRDALEAKLNRKSTY